MAEDKYSFNQVFLKENIEKLNNRLSGEYMSKNKRQVIKSSVSLLSSFLENATSYKNDQEDIPLSLKIVLEKMKRDYELVDKKVLDYIIDLSSITNCEYLSGKYYCDINPEDIVNSSLEVYRKFIPMLEKTAKKIINDPRRLINFSSESDSDSICFKPVGLKVPFIAVFDYKKRPFIFIHELQHGIEIYKNYKNNDYYEETGAILLETLYVDEMIRKETSDTANLYYWRINNILSKIQILNSYFLTLQKLNKYNFSVSESKFINILKDSNFILKGNGLRKTFDMRVNGELRYIYSFLKSIELRELFYQDKRSGWYTLEKILTNTESYINKSALFSIICLEKYLKEIEQKKKELTIKKIKKM